MTGTKKPKSPWNLKHFLLPGCGRCRGTPLAAFYHYWKKSTKSQKEVWRCNRARGPTFFTWAKEPCQGSQKCHSGWAPVTCEARRYLQCCPALCLQGWGKPQIIVGKSESRSKFLKVPCICLGYSRMGIRHSLLGWGHRLYGPQAATGRPHSHGSLSFPWEVALHLCSNYRAALAAAPAGALSSSSCWSSPENPLWWLQWPLPAYHLCRLGHCVSSSSRTFSGRCCDWPVSLVCPSAERFSLEKQDKTGNSEQSRDVVWSQMCWWVLQRKHFLFELSAPSVAWHNILSSF